MAPTTRRISRTTPPPGPLEPKEADTVKKCRFYDAYDRDYNEKSLRQIARETPTSEGTARRWLRQRESLGSIAYRTTRKRSTKLGRPSKVTKSMCKMLVNPSKNPVRDQPYEAQIEYHHIPVGKRQLQRKLKEHTNRGQRYKCAFVKKVISTKNRQERVEYTLKHINKPVEDF